MPHTHVELSQTGFQGRPHEDHENVKIHRLNESLPTDKPHYLMAGIAEFHVGEPIPVHYAGPAVAYIVEGELHVEDQSKPGEIVKLAAGDVLHIEQGSFNMFSTPNKAKMFGVSYAPSNIHPEDMVVKN